MVCCTFLSASPLDVYELIFRYMSIIQQASFGVNSFAVYSDYSMFFTKHAMDGVGLFNIVIYGHVYIQREYNVI